ncbi:transposase [Nocardia sp. NPDC050712]|uniref:IS110 family transposase n=1 Tax=Nocardia sp. NPDC050712 TaxID=3155518 RepID=UPI003410CF30
MRVFATGNGRKTDPVDAHSVAMAALHSPNLLRVEPDPDLLLLSMLADRRDELGRARTETINRLHRFLLELFPGGAEKYLSATKARALIATVEPRDPLGKARRRLSVELIGELQTRGARQKGSSPHRRLWICGGEINPSVTDQPDHAICHRGRFLSYEICRGLK